MRSDGRAWDELRPVHILPNFVEHPAGSALIETGKTRVLCTASITEGVPGWLKEREQGWLTAEYAMLPGSSHERIRRERNHPKGRTMEIQRLIGRSLRAGVDLEALGNHTIYIDCDVLQADGGTRTASITGGFVALALALWREKDRWLHWPLREVVVATSCGLIQGEPRLDLHYEEDSRAQVDMNVVLTASGKLIEVQATAESGLMTREELDQLMTLAIKGGRSLAQHVLKVLHPLDPEHFQNLLS